MDDKVELTALKVAVGSIYLALGNILSTLIGVLGYAYLSRAITQEEMGIVAGLTLLYSLVQAVVDLGLNSSIAKFVSEDIGKRLDYSKHIVSALMLRLPLTLVVASSIAIFSTQLSQAIFKNPAYSNLLILVAIDTVLISITPLFNNTLLGLGRLKKIAIYGVASICSKWLFITIFLLSGQGLTGVIYGWIIGDIALITLLTTSTLKHTTASKHALNELVKILLQMLKFSLPLYISVIISFLYTWYDKALILAFLPLDQLGIYNIAYIAFSVLASIASSLGLALLPYYGSAYGRNDHKAISEAVKRATRYTMLIISPLALGLAATAKPVITLFAGQQYEPGWPILATLALFGLVYAVSPAFSNLLLIYGKTKTILLLNLTSVAISLILFPLLWLISLTGLATMRGASILLTFTLALYFISKTVKIEIDRKVAIKTLAASVTMAATVIIAEGIFYSSLLLPLYILVGCVAYAVAIRAFKTLNEDDIQLIKQVAGGKAAELAAKLLLGKTLTK